MKKREIIFILSSTFVVVVAWIAFSIYHNRITSTIPDALSIKIAPIEKSFDLETIENLKTRERISPISESDFLLLQQTTPPPTGGPTPQATQSALLSPTPATQGGTLGR
ncbi:MAG: hypothetical protein HY429_03755 [Candidatus Levybacteria bacterium]|nr:hypothetical protein [Candidatus Levybacteria bacterium]